LQVKDDVRVPPVKIEAPVAEPRTPRVPPKLLETIHASIIREDERLIVIDKPAGIAVHGGSGVSFGIIEALRALRPDESLELVHRLDRDTSGCLLIARKPSSLRTTHALLREGEFEKGYLALVMGKWNLGKKRIDAPLRTDLRVSGERTVKVHPSGKAAISEFRPVQFFGNRATLVEVSIFTGRTHQIRVHATHAGHPVAGDEKYGDKAFNESMRLLGLDRMFLHAHRVAFEWPQGGEFAANAPLPPDLAVLLDRLDDKARAIRSRQNAARPRAR
jgi:23S rRNA pseudouridine955/2504/2580 synthase